MIMLLKYFQFKDVLGLENVLAFKVTVQMKIIFCALIKIKSAAPQDL